MATRERAPTAYSADRFLTVGQQRFQLIPIRDVPRRLSLRCAKRRIHGSVVYPWIYRGLRDVQPEAVRNGRSTCAPTKIVRQFAHRLE